MHAYCPKHYKRGTLKIKVIKGHSYAYVHHWHLKQAIDCYLGQADKIDLKNMMSQRKNME